MLEFVTGRPLDAVLKTDGPFAPADAVAIARQIADAIAAAHEKGIIHRDLKPGNVMLGADGRVTVLDFGLGKSLDDGRSGPSQSAAANSPTITLGATQAGIVLGTAGYMSPEQAKGHAADRRSDVWSFGCVLFELLAGSRAFEGDDITDTIAAIVRGEPNMKALPASTPPALRHLIERALIKDRNQRLPDMSVVRYILNEPGLLNPGGSGSGAQSPAVPVATRPSLFWMIAALALAVVSVGLAIAYVGRGSATPATAPAGTLAQFTIALPDDTEVANTNMAPLAIAPGGQLVAFAGRHAGRTQLYINDFSTGQTKALDGTDDARSPFFSPDGRWIGFFAKGKLKKVTVGGTSLQDIADAPDARGGTWAADEIIYYAPTNTSGLWKVAASAGTPIEITKPDRNASEISHRYPHALADGKALLFMVWTGPGSDEHRIEYLTLADNKRQVVAQNADGPISVVNGRIMYTGRQDTLLSAPWSPSRLSLQGVEPTALPFFAPIDNEGASAYAVADTGTLVRLMGHTSRRLAKIVWIDRSGKIEPLPLPDRDYVSATISPDGTRAAIHSRGPTEEIWIYDFGTKGFTPLVTSGGSSQAPVWTTDSRSIVYRGTRQGFRNLYRKAADDSGAEERLTAKAGIVQTPTSATLDGKWIVFVESGMSSRDGPTTSGSHIWKVALDGAHETVPVTATPASENGGQVSPDGRWIAFETPITGRPEVWVQPFAAPGPMRQISRDGSTGARWSRDGRELYIMTPDGISTVTVSGDTFSLTRQIIQGRFRLPANANTNYDVARDGRFLHVQPIEPNKPVTRIEVVLYGIGK